MADNLGNRRSCSSFNFIYIQVCKKKINKETVKLAVKLYKQEALTGKINEMSCLQNIQWHPIFTVIMSRQ